MANHRSKLPRKLWIMYTSKNKANSVKGIPVNDLDSSLGTAVHGQQVAPARHQATVCNTTKQPLRIGSWNVRTLFQKGKLENVKQEMARLKVNILGICETRWINSDELYSDDFHVLYSGGEKHERGVAVILDKECAKSILGWWALSDRIMLVKLKGRQADITIIQVYAPTSASSEEEIDSFYDSLEKAKKQCKSTDVTIIMGDLNAKVGNEPDGETVGKFGLGTQNERGERWVQWCKANEYVITNTWYEQHPRRLWTWRSPGDDVKNQIDYIAIKRRYKSAIQQSKAYPGADCGSDHNPVICKLKVKLKVIKKGKSKPRLAYDALLNNQTIRDEYAVTVQNQFEVLENERNTKWEAFKEATVSAAKRVVPKREKKSKNKWITNEILDLMQSRQQISNHGSAEYKQIDKEIRVKCREAKEIWLNEQCEEIERCKNTEPGEVHRKIKEITGFKGCSSTGCIRSKDGEVIMEKDKILERWTEYIDDLFTDDRGEKPEIRKTMEGPEILSSEVRAALQKMKRNKAAGPDEVVIEMIVALEDFGVEKLTEVLNEVYDCGEIPEDLSKSIFIALPKKPGAIECELHRTISLMSHVVKILLRILMMRARSRIKPEIGKEQFGFVQDAGTRNAIFILRMLSERAIEMQKDLYVCFIDYTKAFDKVQHEELFKLLHGLDLDGKDLRVLRNLYWEQTACMRVGNDMSSYTNIRRGVRQGCVLSPDLFNFYGEIIFRDITSLQGILVGGHNINNLRYADDSTLLAESEKELQKMVDTVVESSKRKGLTINCKKTVCMVISKHKLAKECKILIDDTPIKQVKKFNYLGSLITEDGKCDQEIRKRIGMAKDAFEKLGSIMKNNKISMKTKIRMMNCYVFSILTYGSECWNISQVMEKRIEAAEMWFLRRMMRISWTERMTNKEVLERAGIKRFLLKAIRKRQLEFLGHVMRKEGLENLSVTGKINGKRSRGRQRLTYIASISRWMNATEQEVLNTTKDRKKWKSMIANVLVGQGT